MDSKVFKWWVWILSYSLSYVIFYTSYVLSTYKRGSDIGSPYGYFRNVIVFENGMLIYLILIFASALFPSLIIFLMSEHYEKRVNSIHLPVKFKHIDTINIVLGNIYAFISGFFYSFYLSLTILSMFLFLFFALLVSFLWFMAAYATQEFAVIVFAYFRFFWQIAISIQAFLYSSYSTEDISYRDIFLGIFAADVVGFLVAWFAASIYMGMLDIEHVGWRSHVAYSVALFAGGIFGGVLSGWSLARALLPESSLQRILPFNAEGLRNSVVIPLVFHVGVVVMLAIVVRKLGW